MIRQLQDFWQVAWALTWTGKGLAGLRDSYARAKLRHSDSPTLDPWRSRARAIKIGLLLLWKLHRYSTLLRCRGAADFLRGFFASSAIGTVPAGSLSRRIHLGIESVLCNRAAFLVYDEDRSPWRYRSDGRALGAAATAVSRRGRREREDFTASASAYSPETHVTSNSLGC